MTQYQLKKWDESTIKSYLTEEFPNVSREHIDRVTNTVYAEDKSKLNEIANGFRSDKNMDKYPKFKSLSGQVGETNVLVSMLDGIHRRFVGD